MRSEEIDEYLSAHSTVHGPTRSDAEYLVSYVPPSACTRWSMLRLPMAWADGSRIASPYNKMAETNVSGESLATEGLADTAIYIGKFEEARTLLIDGIGRDSEAGMPHRLARKAITLASILTMKGSPDSAQEAIKQALEQSRAERILFPAALLLIQLRQANIAAEIAHELGGDLQPYPRAYGKLIEGILAMAEGDDVAAIDLVKKSIDLTDLWVGRFHLGIIYLEAGYPAEALSQFALCETRIAEASSLFLDDMPTWRYTTTLAYWKARANEAIDMRTPAVKGYRAFLTLRPEPTDDPLAIDARRRLMALTSQ